MCACRAQFRGTLGQTEMRWQRMSLEVSEELCARSPRCWTSARCFRRCRRSPTGAAARPPDDDAARRPRTLIAARGVERRRAVAGAGDGVRDRGDGRAGRRRSFDDLRRTTTTVTFDPPDYRERAKAAGYRSVLSVLVRGARPAVRAALLVEAAERVQRDGHPARAAHRRARGAGVSHEQLAEQPARAAEARAGRAARGARARRCRRSSIRAPATAAWSASRRRGRRW